MFTKFRFTLAHAALSQKSRLICAIAIGLLPLLIILISNEKGKKEEEEERKQENKRKKN